MCGMTGNRGAPDDRIEGKASLGAVIVVVGAINLGAVVVVKTVIVVAGATDVSLTGLVLIVGAIVIVAIG